MARSRRRSAIALWPGFGHCLSRRSVRRCALRRRPKRPSCRKGSRAAVSRLPFSQPSRADGAAAKPQPCAGATSISSGVRRLSVSPTKSLKSGGGGGIRTHGTLTRTTVFETAPFDHSGTPPLRESNDLTFRSSTSSWRCHGRFGGTLDIRPGQRRQAAKRWCAAGHGRTGQAACETGSDWPGHG